MVMRALDLGLGLLMLGGPKRLPSFSCGTLKTTMTSSQSCFSSFVNLLQVILLLLTEANFIHENKCDANASISILIVFNL